MMQMRGLLAGFAFLLCVTPALAAQTVAGANGNVLMRADTVTYDMDNSVVTAAGHVEVDYNNYVLNADTITYDQKTDTVRAEGHLTMLSPDGNVAFAKSATLTSGMRDGVLESFSALIGKNGRLVASRATRKNGTQTTAYDAAYTPCKICNKPGQRTPVWQVQASRVVHDQTKHRIYFTNAIIKMFGVPVFYAPFFSTADPTVKRQSGLLMPDIGSSSTMGTFVRLPLYISFTDSQDMTIAPLVTSEAG